MPPGPEDEDATPSAQTSVTSRPEPESATRSASAKLARILKLDDGETAKIRATSGEMDATVVDTQEPGRARSFREVQRETEFRAEFHLGPIPPASTLEAYELLVPGSAKLIIKNAMNQSSHRRGLEKERLRADIRQAWWGLWIGAAVAVILITAGAGLVATGHDAAGSTIIVSCVIGWRKMEAGQGSDSEGKACCANAAGL